MVVASVLVMASNTPYGHQIYPIFDDTTSPKVTPKIG